ncbi:hypothetical protein AK830_g7776 [Neonectria ditissima]|uniref:Uncharacterized protein n=1 Tax=Neonectria ditissima TaxID=78410 RepID=A0A0P7BE08_9HYPO|nr:hypothetical protein AK830_g7776 [Neonectria ditissima]
MSESTAVEFCVGTGPDEDRESVTEGPTVIHGGVGLEELAESVTLARSLAEVPAGLEGRGGDPEPDGVAVPEAPENPDVLLVQAGELVGPDEVGTAPPDILEVPDSVVRAEREEPLAGTVGQGELVVELLTGKKGVLEEPEELGPVVRVNENELI